MALEVFRTSSILVARGATWDINAKASKADFASDYRDNPVKAMRDYEAIPPESVQAAFHDKEVIERLANKDRKSPVLDDGGYADWFVGDPRFEYYFHADLSLKRDGTGIGMCHYDLTVDRTVVDLIQSLIPTPEFKLSFERILHIIFTLKKRGFNLKKVTFDGWQSLGTIERLINADIESEVYSLDRTTQGYDTLISEILTGKLDYYFHALFIKELNNLKLLNGKKYDHPPEGSKDTSDAVAGCVTQCVLSRLGLSLGDTGVDGAVHQDHVLPLETHEPEEEGGGLYYSVTGRPFDQADRARRRVMRVDLLGSDLVTVLGWNDKDGQRIYVDEYLIWYDLNQVTLPKFETFLVDLMSVVQVYGYSLGQEVPVEVIHSIQKTGRPISSPQQTRVPGQHRRMAQAGTLSPAAVRSTIDHLKRNVLTIPFVLELSKDLKYATADNLMERPYLCTLAAWVEFCTKETMFGKTGRTLPAAISSAPAPTSPMMHPGVSQRSSGAMSARLPGGGHEIDRIRAQHGYTPRSGTSRPMRPASGDGSCALPRIKRV